MWRSKKQKQKEEGWIIDQFIEHIWRRKTKGYSGGHGERRDEVTMPRFSAHQYRDNSTAYKWLLVQDKTHFQSRKRIVRRNDSSIKITTFIQY